MFIKDINPERLAQLTPEQRKIVDRWDSEACEREKLIPEMIAAYEKNDLKVARELGAKIVATDAEYCEHGRHKYSAHCFGCDEIERILFPENFQDDEDE